MEFIQKKDIPYFTECEPLVEGLGFKLVDLNVLHKKDVWQVKAVIKSAKTVPLYTGLFSPVLKPS